MHRLFIYKKKMATLLVSQLMVFSLCLVIFPAAASAGGAPATQSHPADTKAHAHCTSSQHAVQITSGRNRGKWYCVNNQHGGGGGGGFANGGAGSVSSCSHSFFGLVPWYNYLGNEFSATSNAISHGVIGDTCSIKCFNFFTQSQPNDCGQKRSDVPYVLLAIVDDLLRIAGLVAIAFVIIGALRYITSQGNPEETARAQSTIVNALIGLAVAIVAVAAISYIGSRL